MAVAFYEQPTLVVARSLIGKELVTYSDNGACGGIIIETEAYGPSDDLASHASSGMRERNRAMFEGGGICYVYRSYGIHWCMNVVTETAGLGCAVLVRALLPTTGQDLMGDRRGRTARSQLTSGPGRICQALGIDISFNFERFDRSERIAIFAGSQIPDDAIRSAPRVGISKATELPWRYLVCPKFLRDNVLNAAAE